MFPPQEGADAPLFRRTDVSPEKFFQALGRLRRAARDEIEALINWLDSTIDCDEDSQIDDGPVDGDDFEPSLGSFDRMSNQINAWRANCLQAEMDPELDDCDREDSDYSGAGDFDGLLEQTDHYAME